MSGNSITVLDSNVLIDMSKGKINFEQLEAQYQFLSVSIITYIEVMGFNFTSVSEELFFQSALESFQIIYIDEKIAETTIAYRKRKKIKLPDALIAATAKRIGADLLTRNVRDFQDLDASLAVIEPPRVT